MSQPAPQVTGSAPAEPVPVAFLGRTSTLLLQDPAASLRRQAREVQAKLADMLAGKFTRKDVFKGPIKDNTGKIIVPDGVSLTDEDLQGIDAQTISSNNLANRTACTICMNWLADGVQGTIPAMPSSQ